jgi:DNA-binding response OmpR family regulator
MPVKVEPTLRQGITGGSRGTLLLVEDDETIQETLGELLGDDGYAVTRVGTIADGIAELGSREYDVVVLDLELPDGSGFDLAREARSTCNARTPLIAMTAYGELLNKPEARSFTERLKKPVDKRVLGEALARAMQEASRETSLSLWVE